MPKGAKKPYIKSSNLPIDKGKLAKTLKLKLDQKKSDLIAYIAAANPEIEHLKDQIAYLKGKAGIKVKQLEDGTKVFPFFPTHRIKTLQGSIGTVTSSTTTRVHFTLDKGKKSWAKPEDLVSIQKLARQTGTPEQQIPGFIQAGNNESDNKPDDESDDDSPWDSDTEETIRLCLENSGDHEREPEGESESD